MTEDKEDGSLLLRAVEAVAISPAEARVIAERYERQFRDSSTRLTDREIMDLVVRKIINRYRRMAALAVPIQRGEAWASC